MNKAELESDESKRSEHGRIIGKRNANTFLVYQHSQSHERIFREVGLCGTEI